MDIKVIYTIPKGIDIKFDKKLEEALAKIGFHWWASGFNMETRERDIAFSNEINNIERKEPDKQPAQRSQNG